MSLITTDKNPPGKRVVYNSDISGRTDIQMVGSYKSSLRGAFDHCKRGALEDPALFGVMPDKLKDTLTRAYADVSFGKIKQDRVVIPRVALHGSNVVSGTDQHVELCQKFLKRAFGAGWTPAKPNANGALPSDTKQIGASLASIFTLSKVPMNPAGQPTIAKTIMDNFADGDKTSGRNSSESEYLNSDVGRAILETIGKQMTSGKIPVSLKWKPGSSIGGYYYGNKDNRVRLVQLARIIKDVNSFLDIYLKGDDQELFDLYEIINMYVVTRRLQVDARKWVGDRSIDEITADMANALATDDNKKYNSLLDVLCNLSNWKSKDRQVFDIGGNHYVSYKGIGVSFFDDLGFERMRSRVAFAYPQALTFFQNLIIAPYRKHYLKSHGDLWKHRTADEITDSFLAHPYVLAADAPNFDQSLSEQLLEMAIDTWELPERVRKFFKSTLKAYLVLADDHEDRNGVQVVNFRGLSFNLPSGNQLVSDLGKHCGVWADISYAFWWFCEHKGGVYNAENARKFTLDIMHGRSSIIKVRNQGDDVVFGFANKEDMDSFADSLVTNSEKYDSPVKLLPEDFNTFLGLIAIEDPNSRLGWRYAPNPWGMIVKWLVPEYGTDHAEGKEHGLRTMWYLGYKIRKEFYKDHPHALELWEILESVFFEVYGKTMSSIADEYAIANKIDATNDTSIADLNIAETLFLEDPSRLQWDSRVDESDIREELVRKEYMTVPAELSWMLHDQIMKEKRINEYSENDISKVLDQPMFTEVEAWTARFKADTVGKSAEYVLNNQFDDEENLRHRLFLTDVTDNDHNERRIA